VKNCIRLAFAVALACAAFFPPQEAAALTCDDCVLGCQQGYCNEDPDPNCEAEHYWICEIECGC
jgi:hypothetical protein